MLRFLSHLDKRYFLLIFPVLHMTVPWLQYRVRSIIPFFFVCFWFLLTPKKNIVKNSVSNLHKIAFIQFFLAAVLYVLLKDIFALFHHGAFSQYFEYAAFLSNEIFCLVLYYSIVRRKWNELKFLLVISLLGIIMAGFGSFLGGHIYGIEGGRSLKDVNTLRQASASAIAQQVGMVGYAGSYYAALFAGAALIAFVKIKVVILKALVLLSIFASIASVAFSGFATPFMLLLFEFSLFGIWFFSRNRILVTVAGALGGAGLIMFIFNPTFFSVLCDPLEWVASFFPEGSIKTRILSVVSGLSGDGQAYSVERYQLQGISIRTFLNHPFIGVGDYNHQQNIVGGHSELLDRLAYFGLFGFITYVFYLVSLMHYFKVISRYYFGFSWFVMPVMVLVGFIFTTIANPIGAMPGFVYIALPGFALFFPQRNRKDVPVMCGDPKWERMS